MILLVYIFISIFALFNPSLINAVSGDALWAKSIQSAPSGSYSYFSHVANDSSGNSYTVGYIGPAGTFNVGNSIAVTGVYAGSNAVIVKYDSTGSVIWAKSPTTAPGTSSYYGVTVDSSGNIYAAGYIFGSSQFDFGDGVTATGAFAMDWNAILIKYNSDGVAQWAKTTTVGPGVSMYKSVHTDSSGNIYAAGTIDTDQPFGFGNSVTVSGGFNGSNGVLVKYDTSGIPQWAQTTTTAPDNSFFNGVTVDPSGNAIVTGSTTGTSAYTYGVGVSVVGNNIGSNFIVIKYSSAGTPLWGKTNIATSNSSELLDVSVDSSGNIYSAGIIYGLGPLEFGDGVSTTAGSADRTGFIVKYDSGGVAQWATSIGTSGPSIYISLAADTLGNTYAVGFIEGVNTFNFGNSIVLTGASAFRNAFVVKYNNVGSAQWARTTITAASEQYFYGASIDSLGNVFASGYIAGNSPYEFGNSVTLTGGSDNSSPMLVKYSGITLTYAAGSNGSIGGTTPQTVNVGGSGTTVTAVPSTNYHFVDWSDGILTASRLDVGVTGDISVTANFAPDAFTLTYAAGSNGSIGGTTPQTVNVGGSGTTVTAVPSTNYHFVDWSDGILTASRLDVGVTGNVSATANFAINTNTVTYTALSHGTISGTSPQTIDVGGSSSPVTAVGDTGYVFLKWSDNSTTNPRFDIGVTGDITVSAEFTNTRTISSPDPTTLQNEVTSNYISISGTDPSATDNFTFNVSYTFVAATATVIFPANTVVTKTGGGTIDLTSFITTDTTSTTQSELDRVLGAIKLGIPSIGLSFSQNITVTIPVGSSYDGQTLTVYSKPEGSSTWGIETTCLIASGVCTFQTNHATTFTTRSNPITPTSTPTPTPTPTSSPSSNSSSPSSSANNNSAPTCGSSPPTSNPDLFRISATKGSAKLIFSPVPGSTTGYVVMYGLKKGDERYAATFSPTNNNQGEQTATINKLNPKTTYYFKVAAINNCVFGPWSEWAPVKADRKKEVHKYKTIIKNKIKTLINQFK